MRTLASPEKAAEAVRVAGQLEGMSPEEAQKMTWVVFGSNQVAQRGHQLASISRIFHEGNVLTTVEEVVEGRLKASIAQNLYTREDWRGWVRLAEQAAGQTFLPVGDQEIMAASEVPRALIEAVSAITTADVLGRRKDGSRLPAGSITEGLRTAIQRGTVDAKEGSRLLQFLRAARSYFGQVLQRAAALKKAQREGKLGADWQSQLDSLLGFTEGDRGAEQEGGFGTNGEQRTSEDPSFAVRVGASLNSQKKEIPKTTDKMPRFPIHGEFNKALAEVVAWMKAHPTATTPDGKTILIANPEGGSLEKRAEHWMASYKKDDKWQRDGRKQDDSKLVSIAAIATTLKSAQVKALSGKGSYVYLRRYADNHLHAVFVDQYNRVTEHGLVQGGVVTQYTLDPKRGIEGAVVIQDWTAVAPAYSVNPVKGAESDRVSTPGRPLSDQQGDTSAPTAHSYLNAEGAIVKTPPNSSADSATPSDETFSLTYRARQKAQDQLAQQAIESILHHEQSRETTTAANPSGLRSDGPRGDAQKSADTVTSALLRGSEGSSLGWHRDGGRGRRRDFEVAYLNRQATLPHDKGEKLGSGGEHTVHHRDGEIYVTKATHSGKYGQVFDQMGPDEGFRFSLRSALPSEYLFRLGLANKVFGDDVRVIGYERTADGPAIITTQSHLEGPHPRQEEVDNFLRFNGFKPMDENLYDTKTIHETKRPWYRDKDGVVVVDAKRQNFVLHNGKIIPVDLMIQILPDEVLEKTRAARVK